MEMCEQHMTKNMKVKLRKLAARAQGLGLSIFAYAAENRTQGTGQAVSEAQPCFPVLFCKGSGWS